MIAPAFLASRPIIPSMANTGRPPKPADRRQNRSPVRNKVVELAPAIRADIPPPPKGLLKQTEEVWAAYWADDVSRVAQATDLHAIRRLVLYIDEWERALRGFRDERWVQGSTGQPRLNPMGEMALKLEGVIVRLATELGLTPYARMKLGIAVGQAAKTLDDLKREAERGDDDNDGDSEPDEIDPRFAPVGESDPDDGRADAPQ